MDALLCDRFPGGCTLWQGWPLWTVHTRDIHALTIGAALCRRGAAPAGSLPRLDRLFQERYAPPRWSTPTGRAGRGAGGRHAGGMVRTSSEPDKGCDRSQRVTP